MPPGSSPQVRGKLFGLGATLAFMRLIPAGAGKTQCEVRFDVFIPAHPRRCGENKPAFRLGYQLPGSSPQVRGKQPYPQQLLPLNRLIPAGAGKTKKKNSEPETDPAHPRRCGENIVIPRTFSTIPGSSPQVRGKLLWILRRFLLHRLIPAGAGKT